jgi:sorbitol/mannitol transport system permease protein
VPVGQAYRHLSLLLASGQVFPSKVATKESEVSMTTLTTDVETGSPTKTQKRMVDRHGKRVLSLAVPRALLWPALVVAIVLTQIPFLVTVYFSTQKWNLLRPLDRGFVGFDNFVTVFSSDEIYKAIQATATITGTSVLLSLVFGLGLALLLDRQFLGRSVARTLLITPFLVMPAAAALAWKWNLLDGNFGLFKWLFVELGLPVIEWNTDIPIVTVIMVLTWQFMPFMMLILLAGLQSQDKEVLEAAQVDGAGAFRIFMQMTLPHLRQYIEIGVLLGAILLLASFDPIAILTGGSGGTKTLPVLLYEKAFVALEVGQAAAYGVVTVAITIIFALLLLRTVFRIFSEQGVR